MSNPTQEELDLQKRRDELKDMVNELDEEEFDRFMEMMKVEIPDMYERVMKDFDDAGIK